MGHYDDFSIPFKPIFWSFVLCMVLDFIPLGEPFFWLPEFTALLLVYWLVHAPQRIGLFSAFLVGLLMDIGTVAPLGSHALAYCLSSFVMMRHRRQFSMQNYGFQALAVVLVLAANEVVLAAVRWVMEQRFAGWQIFAAPLTAALMWPLLNKIMLYFTNYKRLHR
ncbi:rod shape-determining protein MreD [Conchiformibius steedae DSM 2580]|uniref:Rod shape-determining protein MreD n=1 Tax=Conchiformibius steedae DSM 2580 TaxID=1121352 RepID=A0AAE9HWA9_9NEIS|nr:rod shape-determining protein MreD [Conchiformibius steedae]QMT33153.1 rod shape-determining protein MreD [Conchiformibius steedae]URD67788.1 rod shape-determining protein MreD [Conchiformibius steedae DSM 2580]